MNPALWWGADAVSPCWISDIQPTSGDALLIIDVQNDFLPGGVLPVSGGDAIVAPLNEWIDRFASFGLPIFATRDWHPVDHCSFRAQGGAWPPHCIAGTPGAEFPLSLKLPSFTQVVSKGQMPQAEAYSGFSGTDLDRQLRLNYVNRLFVGGLATDYCVLATVIDGLRLNYRILLLADAVRAVDVRAGDGDRAIKVMCNTGAVLVEG